MKMESKLKESVIDFEEITNLKARVRELEKRLSEVKEDSMGYKTKLTTTQDILDSLMDKVVSK